MKNVPDHAFKFNFNHAAFSASFRPLGMSKSDYIVNEFIFSNRLSSDPCLWQPRKQVDHPGIWWTCGTCSYHEKLHIRETALHNLQSLESSLSMFKQ